MIVCATTFLTMIEVNRSLLLLCLYNEVDNRSIEYPRIKLITFVMIADKTIGKYALT